MRLRLQQLERNFAENWSSARVSYTVCSLLLEQTNVMLMHLASKFIILRCKMEAVDA